MKKMISFRNAIIAILCVTIIFLSIGFIVLSIKFKELNEDVDSYNVTFMSIEKISSIKGSNVEPISNAKIIENHKEIEMQFDMSSVHDEVVYIATIRNNGTMKAKIVDIMGSPDYTVEPYKTALSPVVLTLSDVKGKVLEPNQEVELRIALNYNVNGGVVPTKKVFNYKLGLITEYDE